ncbi:MAG: hypothetical protein ACLUGI_07985 [Subdoligranulum sp.]
MNGSDFVSSKSPVSVKVGFVQETGRMRPFSNCGKMCMIKTTKGAHEKAPQRLKEENQNEKQAHDERRHSRSDGWFSGSLRRFHYRQQHC